MTHIALYRKWRSQSFGEMVGQPFVTQTLQNSLREGRFSHAYLFSGPRGTGKTSAAKILAKAVNCENGPAAEPCNRCSACERITKGTVMDVLEIDAASNRGVEEIRDIRDKVRFAPTEVRRKVYIIDEVHMLTTEAFNALLKTLEEPPAHVMFILATTEPHRLPATIISRCQRFDFKRITLQEQTAHLRKVCEEEGIEIEEQALQYIARLSDGGMRDAISLLDQISSFASGEVTLEDVLMVSGGVASEQFGQLAEAIQGNNVGQALELIDHWMQEGKNADKCLESMIIYFRDLLLVKMAPNSRSVTERIFHSDALQGMAERFTHQELVTTIEVLNGFQTDLKFAAQPQTLFEVAVLKVCSILSSAEEQRPGQSGKSPSAPSSQSVGAGESSDPAAVAQLKAKLEQLELQVTQLSGLVRQMSVADKELASGAEAKTSISPSVRQKKPNSIYRNPSIKLDRFLSGDGEQLKRIVAGWSGLLAKVKEKKIMVHAWLIDGEPVAIASDTGEVLVAFKSAMHRETTEKPANRQIIEQAFVELFGEPITFSTVMVGDWKEACENIKGTESDRQASGTSSTTQLSDGSEQSDNPEWVDAAIELFGEQLVKIKK